LSSPEVLLARILERVPQPVWVVDHSGFITFANPAACSALGYHDPGELLGKSSHETVHYRRQDGTPFPEAECLMLRPRQTGETVHSDDDWFVRRDGSMFPIAWWSAPIDMPGGRGAVLAFTDITNLAQDQIRCPKEDLSLLDSAIEQAGAALDELRELAAGIHPPILTSRGLGAAVKALARRSALPVTISAAIPDRLPEAVEANVYFLTAQALTNAVKHARATHVTVSMNCDDETFCVEIQDDGIGGAHLDTDGTGMKGMADRATALGGRLTVRSPALGGTYARAAFPRRAWEARERP
jgi:PAS domain S-box-containing protein